MRRIIKRQNGALFVFDGEHRYRRLKDKWEMLGVNYWFDCEIHDPAIRKMVADYENCLKSYTFDEGPNYPQCSKKGNVGAFFLALQTKELYACTKGIFAAVPMKYTIPKPKIASGPHRRPEMIENDDVRNFAYSQAEKLAKMHGYRAPPRSISEKLTDIAFAA